MAANEDITGTTGPGPPLGAFSFRPPSSARRGPPAIIFGAMHGDEPSSALQAQRLIEELLDRREAFVVYESPHRILKLLADLTDLLPECTVLIGREMTKLHEDYRLDSARGHFDRLQESPKILGEFTLLVSPDKMA